jgi:hypothetical protein
MPSGVLAYYRVLADVGQDTIDEAAEAVRAKLAAEQGPPRAGGALRALQPSELVAVLHGPTEQGWCHGYRVADPAAPGWFALSCCGTPAVAAAQLSSEEQAHGAAAAKAYHRGRMRAKLRTAVWAAKFLSAARPEPYAVGRAVRAVAEFEAPADAAGLAALGAPVASKLMAELDLGDVVDVASAAGEWLGGTNRRTAALGWFPIHHVVDAETGAAVRR